jgi:hypothetical protein
VPLLQLHGADDGCILPQQVDDRHRFAASHALEVVPDVGHFLHIEAPEAIAERIAAWGRVASFQPYEKTSSERSSTTGSDRADARRHQRKKSEKEIGVRPAILQSIFQDSTTDKEKGT